MIWWYHHDDDNDVETKWIKLERRKKKRKKTEKGRETLSKMLFYHFHTDLHYQLSVLSPKLSSLLWCRRVHSVRTCYNIKKNCCSTPKATTQIILISHVKHEYAYLKTGCRSQTCVMIDFCAILFMSHRSRNCRFFQTQTNIALTVN